MFESFGSGDIWFMGASSVKIERSSFVNSSQTQKWSGKHGSHDPKYKLDRDDSSRGDVAKWFNSIGVVFLICLWF